MTKEKRLPMRGLVLFMVLGAAAPAVAERSVDVFVIADAAAPASELAAWSKVLGALSPGTPIPSVESLPAVLGSLVGAQRLEGVDPQKPWHLVLLNPQKYPHPTVLWVP